ncbi:hypothetical protein [Amycolatopsis sp. CA-230715]|uniref:hypothetical protein n=1 Tax=Amycolatopsis sp. CA-230715 TaxID=2745196 RepID=UPI001C02D30C|nr:hypothetical protein [Amycolatopsis sp. CA-230715]
MAERVNALAEHATGIFNAPHDVVDRGKLAALMRDMAERGWQGPPLLVDGENAFTGSHRIGAVSGLWNTECIEIVIPYVEAAELCAEFDVDWATLVEDNAADFGDITDLSQRLAELLPAEVVDYLGMDLH